MARLPLTVVYPGELASPTGGYGYARRMITELSSLGWTIDLIALSPSYPFPSDADSASAEADIAAIPDGRLTLVDGLAFGAMPEIAARHGARLRLTALVHHPLAYETGLDDRVAAVMRASERAALAYARGVIATSGWTGRQLVAEYAVDPSRLSIAIPGVERFGRARVNGEPPVILSLGALTRRKGTDLLIDALGQLAHLPWLCRIVGDPSRDQEWSTLVRRRAAASGVADRIAFTGVVEDVRAELLAADIFALPSRYEGYGMAFAEALVCGLPIVGCAAGAVPDLVAPAAGILAPVDDTGALAEALRTLIADADARSRMAAAAFAAGAMLPSWEDTGRSVSAALERLVAP